MNKYSNPNSIRQFKIVCIETCTSVTFGSTTKTIKKGEILSTNEYEFNYGGFINNDENLINARLFKNGEMIGLFKQKNFIKIDELRDNIINELLTQE